MTRGLSLLVKLMEQAAETAKEVMLDPPSRTEAGQTFQRSRAQARLGRLDREIRAAKQQAAQAIPPALSAAFTAGVKEADRQTTNIPDIELGTSTSRVGASLNLVDSRRARILVDNAVGDIGKSLDTTKRQVDRFVRQARALGLDGKKIQTLIAGGTLEGAPRASLAAVRAEVKKIVKEDGKVWVVDKNGELMRFKPEVYADLVFQTTQAEATNIGTLERLQQKKIDLVKIIGSDSANFCTDFKDKVYSISGTHPTYPPLSVLPRGGAPFHPRCTKRYVAFNERLASAAEIDKAKPDEKSQRHHGQSPGDAQRTFEAGPRDRTKSDAAPQTSPPPQPANTGANRDAGRVPVAQPADRPAAGPRPLTVRETGPNSVELVDVEGAVVTEVDVARPEVRASAVRAVQRVSARGLPVPAEIYDSPESFDFHADQAGVVAGYDRGSILINSGSALWGNITAILAARRREGSISSDDPDHWMNNELGHHVHRVNLNDDARFDAMLIAAIPNDLRPAVIEHVSFYGATSVQEFVAETFAALLAGRPLPEAIIARYIQFGGRIP